MDTTSLARIALACLLLMGSACDSGSEESEPSNDNGKSEDTTEGKSKDKEAEAKAEATKNMKTKKVTSDGVTWEFSMPKEMKAPEYETDNPEFMSSDMKLTLSTGYPEFSTADAYIERNVTTEVMEKVEVGPAVLIISKSPAYKDDEVSYTAIVPGDTIGWSCSGSKERKKEVRAMCESVKFTKE